MREKEAVERYRITDENRADAMRLMQAHARLQQLETSYEPERERFLRQQGAQFDRSYQAQHTEALGRYRDALSRMHLKDVSAIQFSDDCSSLEVVRSGGLGPARPTQNGRAGKKRRRRRRGAENRGG